MLTIGDLVQNFQPQPMACGDCGATFIAHAGTWTERRGGAHDGDDSDLANFVALCGCNDYGAADEWPEPNDDPLDVAACERRAEAFQPGPTPEEMRDDLDEWHDERAAGLEHAAECGAEDATEGESAEDGADAHQFTGRMRSAYLDAWADALADDRRRAAINAAADAIEHDDRTAEERGRMEGGI